MYLRRLWSSCLLAKAHDDGNGLSPLCLSSRRVASSHEYILIHPLDFYPHTPVSIFSLFSSFFPNLQICIFSTIFSQSSANLLRNISLMSSENLPIFGFFQYTSGWVKLLFSQLRALVILACTINAILSFSGAHSIYPSRTRLNDKCVNCPIRYTPPAYGVIQS